MAIPKHSVNSWIVQIERQVRGYGGDRTPGVIVMSSRKANRQPVVLLDYPGAGDRDAQADTDFYFDLPTDPESAFNLRVGDFVTWQPLVNGEPLGTKITQAEVRRIEVNDHPVRLSHVRIGTRGGDGSGA